MTIKVDTGKRRTKVEFKLSGASPNTVFNLSKKPFPAEGREVPSIPALTRPGFPSEGNGVSPLARLAAGFTAGMGLDPGASFVTNHNGDGKVLVELDYDLIRAASLSNKNLILQCAPTVMTCEKPIKVTTTWLRRFIGEFRLEDRASVCANYDPSADPSNPEYDPGGSNGMDARFWQRIDPVTVDFETGSGLPRVHAFAFDDWIDVIERRADIFHRLRKK